MHASRRSHFCKNIKALADTRRTILAGFRARVRRPATYETTFYNNKGTLFNSQSLSHYPPHRPTFNTVVPMSQPRRTGQIDVTNAAHGSSRSTSRKGTVDFGDDESPPGQRSRHADEPSSEGKRQRGLRSEDAIFRKAVL